MLILALLTWTACLLTFASGLVLYGERNDEAGMDRGCVRIVVSALLGIACIVLFCFCPTR